MPIFRGSRYEGSRYTAFIDQEGTVRKYVHPKVPVDSEDLDGDFKVVAKSSGDELDSIAFENGGRERQWWLIAEVSGLTSYPMDVPDGTELIVPSQNQFEKRA